MALQHPGIELPFTSGFYQSRSSQQSLQRCINYYPVIHQAPTLSPHSLYMTSGIKAVIDGLDGVCRGAHEMNGVAYVVCGESLYRIDRTLDSSGNEQFSSTEVGSVPGSNRVVMASGKGPSSGEFHLVVVVPGQTAIYYSTTGFSAGLDTVTNFHSPVVDVVNINGLFLFLNEENVLFHSNLNNATVYNALDTFTITETKTAIAILLYRGQVFVFGDNEIIPFNYIGGDLFALLPQPNAAKPYGIRNVYGKATLKRNMIFLGAGKNSEPSIYLYSGGEPQRISTEVIEYELQGLSIEHLDTAFIDTYSHAGGEFAFITAGDLCFVYNFTTGLWHENRSFVNGVNSRWRVNALCYVYNRILVGDAVDGRIGSLDLLTNTEYSGEIHRSFSLQAFDNKGKALRVKAILLAMDAGFGGQVAMDFTDDGFNWSNSMIKSAGATGEYGRTVRWDTLGSASFFRSLRFGTSTTSNCNINKIIADA